MRLVLISIGRLKQGPERELTERYRERFDEIGRKLGVSERTVTTHLDHIYRKLGATSRVAALSTALRLGVLTLPAEVREIDRLAVS